MSPREQAIEIIHKYMSEDFYNNTTFPTQLREMALELFMTSNCESKDAKIIRKALYELDV